MSLTPVEIRHVKLDRRVLGYEPVHGWRTA